MEQAAHSGLALSAEKNFPALEEKWSILQAVFFSSTVLTTIGSIIIHFCNRFSCVLSKVGCVSRFISYIVD
jgi:hypothetical protein